MMYFTKGGAETSLSDSDLREGLALALSQLQKGSALNKVLAIPPDITRLHSKAGTLTVMAREILGPALTDILPALGTHYPMSTGEIDEMYPGLDHSLFRPHKWREDLCTLGRIPAEFIEEQSAGALSYDWPAQVNRLLVDGNYDAILSIGQVVPHEVIGFANHNKNIFIGTGGSEGIHKSHFLGAVYGMEQIMGRADTPVRRVLNYASDNFGKNLPIIYVLTVVSPDPDGSLKVRGLFIGDGYDCFNDAAALSAEVNLTRLEAPLKKAVVYLDPKEFRSTWLGNKSVYRTRMAMADDGELTVIAPGLKEFGEDREIDRLIRKYGYHGTPRTLESVEHEPELRNNLSAAAHLIHGSSEGRFSITYAPGQLSRDEIEAVGYKYERPEKVCSHFELDINNLGNTGTGYRLDSDGEEYFFIQNPALGLWSANK